MDTLNRIRNESIREEVVITPIVEKIVKSRLRWSGHMRKRPVERLKETKKDYRKNH